MDNESIPVIYHFDSSPGGQPPNGNDPSIFVYSLLNWLAVGKKAETKNQDAKPEKEIFNSESLPLSRICLPQHPFRWKNGYNVI